VASEQRARIPHGHLTLPLEVGNVGVHQLLQGAVARCLDRPQCGLLLCPLRRLFSGNAPLMMPVQVSDPGAVQAGELHNLRPRLCERKPAPALFIVGAEAQAAPLPFIVILVVQRHAVACDSCGKPARTARPSVR
jgi:hypothetical protein